MPTLGDLAADQIYAMIYGKEGVGKTTLPMTLSKNNGEDVAYITPEKRGPTSLLSLGYSNMIPVTVIRSDSNPFDKATEAVRKYRASKKIRIIVVDGCTMLCGRFVRFFTSGGTDKDMGFDGWGELLSNFRNLEYECERAVQMGRSVIYTAWEQRPTYEETMGGSALKEEGRPMIQGKGQVWLPGNCDILGRMTARFTVKNKREVYESYLQVKPAHDWLCKTRFPLPIKVKADLRYILDTVQKQHKKFKSPAKSIAG